MSEHEAMRAHGGGAGLFVRIDHNTCSGTAHCQQAMPHVFVVRNRKSHVRSDVDWSAIERDELERTADSCPWFAITITATPPESTSESNSEPTSGGT